ncbi:12600_t:CDS:2, partial [Dentiscutata heterogama]
SIRNGVEMWLKWEGFIEHCNDKEMFTLAYNNIMESLITMFLQRSENLEELLINDQLMFPTVSTFLNAIPGISQLKTLRVKLDFTNTNILEFMNALTPKACPYLKQLNIKSYLHNDESDALVNIIKSHKKFEKIDLDTYIIGRSVVVYEISNLASEKTIKDFFLFCGRISEFKLKKSEKDSKQIAYITFQKEIAAKTALMLTNAVIGDSALIVKSAEETGYIKIFSALKYVGNSLKELILQYMDFSKISPDNIENISKCQNLVRISFYKCQKMTITHCTSLSKNNLNLKKLEIIGLSFDQIVMTTLISIWGSTLEVLHLDELSQETANALLIHCSNLKELAINNLYANSLKFIYPFLQQSSLKSFIIDTHGIFPKECFDLVPNLPSTLTFLGLYTDFNSRKFKKFVKYCEKFVELKALNIKRLRFVTEKI